MAAPEELGIIFDLPDVDVDTLAAFIHDRVQQRPLVQPALEPPPVVPVQSADAPPALQPALEMPGSAPTTPLARSLSSIGRYLDVLRDDIGAIHEWLRIDAERNARQEYQVTDALNRLAGSIERLAGEVTAVNARLEQLEEAARSIQPESAPTAQPNAVDRIRSVIRGMRS